MTSRNCSSLLLVAHRRVITSPLTHPSRARARNLLARSSPIEGPRNFEKSREPLERDLEGQFNEVEVVGKLRDNCSQRRRRRQWWRACIVARVDAMTSPTQQRATFLSRSNFGEPACGEARPACNPSVVPRVARCPSPQKTVLYFSQTLPVGFERCCHLTNNTVCFFIFTTAHIHFPLSLWSLDGQTKL